jgi:hypothetical protein
MLGTRDRLNRILAKHTGQSVEKIRTDTDRDNFMDGPAAIAYGLIDHVLEKRGEFPAGTAKVVTRGAKTRNNNVLRTTQFFASAVCRMLYKAA